MNEVSFHVTDDDGELIARIVKRAQDLGLVGRKYSGLTCSMDITATHANGNPLDLPRLFAADDFDFTHDICGIARHLNRDTGQLENCFSPRFSQRMAA